MELSYTVILKGPLCRFRERGLPLQPFTAGLCRVIGETSNLEVAHVHFYFYVKCSTLVCSLPFYAAKGKLIIYMLEISPDIT